MSSRKEMDHDFELNIASIVDCFTVLITYLLAAASFISLGMVPMEALVDRTNSTGPQITQADTGPTVQLTVEILESHKIRFSVWNGNESQKEEFAMNEVEAEDQKIETYVAKLKETYPKLEQAIVASDPTIAYGDFIHGADLVKRKFKLFLANGGK